MGLEKTNTKITDANIVKNTLTKVIVGRFGDARNMYLMKDWWDNSSNVHFSKYQIKETDMRVKTATFTSPNYFDLTTGLFAVLITSPYHEDFAGIILKSKYNEDTKEYEYQCQDWSRKYITKTDVNGARLVTYDLIRHLLSHRQVPLNHATKKQLEAWKRGFSGLRPAHQYEQKFWGSTVNFNPMTQRYTFYIRETPMIEIIRGLFFGMGAYVDVYFNKYGVLQIEPYHKDDWLKTGLHLYTQELASRTPEFDTTNILTSIRVKSNDDKEIGNRYDSSGLIGLNLAAFFGYVGGSTSNPNEKKTTTTNTTKKATTTTTNKTGNPYGNKAKKVWIDADSGSGGTKNALANALKRKGWTVHVGGTGPGYHYSDYFNVSSAYQCLITIYNGFCAGTIREAYSSYIQNTLKRKGVVLIPCFITDGWTNPHGMAPYKYGDFSGYRAKRAWDDNFSGSDPSISNVGQFFKKNNAKYLCHPTIDGLVNQFLAGGYFASKGVK